MSDCLKIGRLEARRVRIPLKSPFRISVGEGSNPITDSSKFGSMYRRCPTPRLAMVATGQDDHDPGPPASSATASTRTVSASAE